MTITAATPASGRAGLLEKLMAAVRPEFRVDVYLPANNDPVLGLRPCRVDNCDRSTGEHGLCSSHARRWRRDGCPEFTRFLAEPGPLLHGRSEPSSCTVRGCRYGTSGFGLCMRHRSKWTTAGQPDPADWAANAPTVDATDRAACRLPFCALWVENDKHIFCKSHTTRWRQLGSPDVDEFLGWCLLRGKARIDYRRLAPQLKLEFQYSVQCRHDERVITTPPQVVRWALRQAGNASVNSLLDLSEQQWRQQATDARGWPTARAFLIYARDVVETLRDGSGWEVEYCRDVWRLHKLSGLTVNAGKTPRPRNHVRFDRILQPWLRPLAKRWARLRLTSGLNVCTVLGDVGAISRFSAFLTAAAPAVNRLGEVDRSLLERYLAWLSTQPGGQSIKEDSVGGVHRFFQAIRQHGWDDTLPPTAMFVPGDYPPRPPRLTRHLSEHVMAQIEHPANLDRWPTPEGRLVTLILIRCGLRASDACTLAFDCLLHDGQGAAYLLYVNHKMKRQAAVPIDEELESEIRSQQRRVTQLWPEGNPHLFPQRKANAGGHRCLTYYSYRAALKEWVTACEIRDEHGQPVHLTPHQWRHTFATRLINRDVPQEVVRVLLDHSSSEMTAHYARITDQTVRRHWEQAAKVNIKGERVTIDPDGPLAQAQWAKTRYGIATQTLPNGYCGLPVQKSCPHANACLTCPVFLTGPEFLPELREQRHRTLTLIDVSASKGHTRVVEMNKQVLANLDRMIGEVETDEQENTADAG